MDGGEAMDPDESPGPGSMPSGGYLAVLRIAGAARFSAAGALARLPQGMLGLGSVLLVTGLGRSYTLGGLVAGAISLSQGIVSPQLSRLVDQIGQSRVLRPQLVVHGAALAALIVAGQAGAAGWLLILAGALVGASQPQIGAYARARWTALLPTDRRVQTGLAIESLIDEAVFVVGPFLVTTLATVVAPAAGLSVALALVIIGCLLFLAQVATEPAPHPRTPRQSSDPPFRRSGLIVLVAAFFGIGGFFGLVEVAVVARTRELGAPGAAGALLALWAGTSLLCGTWYGARRWSAGGVIRFQIGTAAMAVGAALIAVSAGSLLLLAGALAIAGLANAPTLITGNTLVPAVVPPSVVTEAYTWLGVAVFAGVAVGSPLGGALIDHSGARAALWAAVVPATLALAPTLAGRRALAGDRRGND